MTHTPLPRKLVLGYGIGSIPAGMLVATAPFIVFYFNQVLGVSATTVGLAVLCASLFDAFTDPPVGALSDRTHSRLGRRHPYLYACAVPIGAISYLIWAPPRGFEVEALVIWLFALTLAGRLATTFYYVPYLALGAELSPHYEERTRIVATRGILYELGRSWVGALLLLVFLRATPEYPNGQMNPEGYRQLGILLGVALPIFAIASAWMTREVIPRLEETARAVATPLWRSIRELSRHRSLRAVLLGNVTKNIAWGMSDALGLYMATYFWHVRTELLFVWGIGMFSGLFLGIPIWRRLAAHYDKKPMFQLGTAIYLVFFNVPYVSKALGLWPDEQGPWHIPLYVLTTGFIAHFGIAATTALAGSMLADVADLDELEHGERREAMIFAVESFSWKAVTGFGALLAGFVVEISGITAESTPESVGPEVEQLLGLSLGCLETVLFVLALIFVSRYDIDRNRHGEIQGALAVRKVAAADVG